MSIYPMGMDAVGKNGIRIRRSFVLLSIPVLLVRLMIVYLAKRIGLLNRKGELINIIQQINWESTIV